MKLKLFWKVSGNMIEFIKDLYTHNRGWFGLYAAIMMGAGFYIQRNDFFGYGYPKFSHFLIAFFWPVGIPYMFFNLSKFRKNQLEIYRKLLDKREPDDKAPR